MARKRYGRKTYSRGIHKSSHRTKTRKKSRYSPLQKLAFKMGRVKLGLEGNTKVADSFNAGATRPKPREKKVKKPVY